MPGGRPPLWETPEQLAKDIEPYWEYCRKEAEIPDVESLACFLDTCRNTLMEYEHKDPEFNYVIKKAKTRIASHKKQMAMKGMIPAAIFCFDFKNNHDYKDNHDFTNTNISVDGDVMALSIEDRKRQLEKLLEKRKVIAAQVIAKDD